MTSLKTNFAAGTIINPKDLNDIAANVMYTNLGIGKGIKNGLVISPGTGLSVNVTAGQFFAQVEGEATAGFSIAVPASYTGYLFIQNPAVSTDPPDSIHQTTTTDPGSTYICIGGFTTSGSAVTSVDLTAAQYFGGDSLTRNLSTTAPKTSVGAFIVAGGDGLASIPIGAGNVTLSATQAACGWLIATGTPGTARALIAPLTAGKPYDVTNNSDGAVTIRGATGTGIVVAVGKTARVRCDGTNFVRISPDV